MSTANVGSLCQLRLLCRQCSNLHCLRDEYCLAKLLAKLVKSSSLLAGSSSLLNNELLSTELFVAGASGLLVEELLLLLTALLGQRLPNALLGHLIGQCLCTCRGSRETLLLSQGCSLRAFLLVSQTSKSSLTELSPGGLAVESDMEAAAAKLQEEGSGGRSASNLLAGSSGVLVKEL